MILESEVSFVHNRDDGWTVGYVAAPHEDSPGRIRVKAAASFCNFRDKFSKKIGRAIVTGRLNCNRDNKVHNTEFFLSGTMPTTGDKWREFEKAVVAETMEAYSQ